MAIDTSKVNQKVSVPTGEILFKEGTKVSSLNILHEGAVLLEKKINGKNFPIVELSGKNLTPGIVSLFAEESYLYTIKTSRNSIISTYNVDSDSIRKTISNKLAIGNMVSRTLFNEIGEFAKKYTLLKENIVNIKTLNDNLGISYYFLNRTTFPDINPDNPEMINDDPGFPDKGMKLVRENLKAYLTNGGKIPEKVTPKFLTQNHSGFLNKEYNNRPELTNQEFQFLRRIIALKPETLAQVYTADINILIYICEKLSDLNLNAIRELEDCIKEFDSDMDMLLGGSDSLIEKYYMSLDLLNSGISEVPREDFLPLTETISGSINNFLQTYKSLFVSEFKNASPNLITFQELSAKLSKELKSGESPSSTTAGTGSNRSNITIGLDAAAIKKELENSASKILNYAGIEIERVKEYSSLVLKMKSLKNPLDPDPDARKIRRNLTKTYWEAYEKSFLKYLQSNKKVPRPIEMMLKFGYFDETLLEDEQLIFLHQQVEKKDTYRDNLVMTFDGTDWLEKIYRKEFTTSLDELGQTFFDKVKADNRNSQYKKESDLPPDVDNGEARLKYEINSMYISNVRLTTGSPASHLPILTKYHIIYPLEKCIVDSKMLIDTLKAIMAIDYTAFYREVIYNEPDLGIRNELVQTEVLPDFIFVPSIGEKIMMWQVLSTYRGAGSKESKGRIIIPRFITQDLASMLTDAIGGFRWELTKEILGVDWIDPGTPSITSAYNDYAEFYKKNKDLSIELKEKITEEFRRFRSHKDRFINDYGHWIKSESEGIQKLNKIVRNMFYRHIPFTNDVRERVCKMPAFLDVHNRFINVRNREFKEKETRYRKYQNLPGGLPKKLQDNLDYYKV